jgi:hypothetical protein
MIMNRRLVSPASPDFRIDLGPRMAWLAGVQPRRFDDVCSNISSYNLSLHSMTYPRPWGIKPSGHLRNLFSLFNTGQPASGPISAVQTQRNPSHSRWRANVPICRCSRSVDYATVNLQGQSIWPAIFARTRHKSHLLARSVARLTFESTCFNPLFASPLT